MNSNQQPILSDTEWNAATPFPYFVGAFYYNAFSNNDSLAAVEVQEHYRRKAREAAKTRKLVTIDRVFTSNGYAEESGWSCWVRVWPDGDVDSGIPSDEAIIRLKKDAIAWAKRKHPGAKISYCTDDVRKGESRRT